VKPTLPFNRVGDNLNTNRMKKVTLILCVKLMAAMMLASCTGGGTRGEEPPNKTALSNEVTIGKQVWMTQNLNVDKFRNGDPIPQARTGEEWNRAGTNKQPAWCYYNNDPANGAKYGKLYNGYAVSDSRGLAPVGYHIPSDAEWTTLTDYLGGIEKAGAKMKSKQGWAKNGNGTNSSGFSGLPGGFRHFDGSFNYIGLYGHWWSSAEGSTGLAWDRDLG